MERKKIFKKLLFYCFIFLAFTFSIKVDAATLQINSNSSTVSAGDSVILYVNVNSEGISINNAGATIKFPNDLFDIVSVSKSGSIFSLWVEEPSFSNSAGTITFDGGLPTPGFNGVFGSVISITAKAKKAGQAEFTFSDAAVRANDGLGTDVLNSQQGKIISIIKKDEPAPVVQPIPEPETQVQNIQNIQISSASHPKQDSWYNDVNPVFSWAVPAGVDAVRTGISENDSDTPTVTYSPAINEKTVNELKDGVWYFKVRPRKGGVWGAVSTYVVKIDTIAPINNKTDFYYDVSNKTININSSIIDLTSGVDHFDIKINNDFKKTVPASLFVDGKYKLDYEKIGNNKIELTVFDKAGNFINVVGNFVVPEIQPGKNNFAFIKNISNSILPIAIFVMVVLILYLLKPYYAMFTHRHKMRNAISNGNHPKALLLLKKSLENHLDLLQETRHRRILTKEEKQIKAGIENDLDELDRAIYDISAE